MILDTQYQDNLLFRSEIPRKKERMVVGRVIVAKDIKILILYIGKIRFVINRQIRQEKRITEKKIMEIKEILLVIHQKINYSSKFLIQ